MSVLTGFCSDLLANTTHSLLLEDRDKQTSSVQQDLDGYLLVTELRVLMANLLISSLRRSCLVGVDVSCSGFMEAGSRRSLGLRPMANSIGVLQLEVIGVLLTVAALRIKWSGVIGARVVRSLFFEAVSASAKRNFLNGRTPISARFGHGVCGPVGYLFTLCILWER